MATNIATKAQHTPGPWGFFTTGDVMRGYSQPLAVCESGKPNMVCGCFGDVDGGLSTAAANAKLIAAAPDMLAALQRIISDLREQEETGLCKRMRINQIVDIDAAIRKATA